MSGVQHLTVGPDEAEQRLDRWFRRRFPHIPQGRIEKLCRTGEIRIDGARAKSGARIRPGQTVRVPPLPEDEKPAPALEDAPVDAGPLLDRVIFRDDALLVLDKPAGLPTQGGTGQRRHIAGLLPGLRFEREDAPRLVHRLDKDTSGLLVLARTGAAAVSLAKAFRSRAVRKEYVALVAGRPQPAAGTIRFGLVKSGPRGHEKMRTLHPDEVRETEGAVHAVTDYQTLFTAGSRAAAVGLRPVTGRTHQLRAHMAALGCPIAGDGKYGGRSQENLGEGWGAGLGGALSRKLHLHAARLVVPHPVSGREMRFSAALPEHMRASWELFGWDVALPEPLVPDAGFGSGP